MVKLIGITTYTRMNHDDYLAKVASERGGKVLSNYTKSTDKVELECFHGHRFKTTVGCIKRGQWCPKCTSKNRSEQVCRAYFESIFGTRFDKIQPDEMVNENGNRLELDGYSSEAMVAFEYNGRQHYHDTEWFHNYKGYRQHDPLKVAFCKSHGIDLIVIPYTVKQDSLMAEIKDQLVNLMHPNIEALNWTEPSVIDIFTNQRPLIDMGIELGNKGFTLLSNEYRGSSFKYLTRCNVCGKERLGYPYALLNNSCQRCLKKEKRTIEDARCLAKSRNGKCLSSEYIRNDQPLTWQCHCGFVWKASFNRIDSGVWCPKCGNVSKSKSLTTTWAVRKPQILIAKILEVKELALASGFECLSGSYVSQDDPLIFKCNHGHEWHIGLRAFKRAIKQGRGCTYCGPNSARATRCQK